MRKSINGLLLFMTFVAVWIVSLKSGGIYAECCSMTNVVLLMAMLVVSFVAIGRLRARAIGYSVPCTFYSALVILGGQNEFDWTESKLPTSAIIGRIYESVVIREFHTPDGMILTQKEIDAGLGKGAPIMAIEAPSRERFAFHAHLILGTIFGALGSAMGVWVYSMQHVEF